MASSEGTKVTKDPQALNNPKNENPGIVTSDSLAGESIKEGGSFAANSDARGPMDQPSAGTTANTTDTSNATRLEPAPDAEARAATSEWSENAQLNAGKTLGKESGVGPTYNAAVGDASNSSSVAGPAPGYASHPAPSMGDTFAPKGKNIQEGGFDSGAPNASFTTDIGGKNDPGRVALGRMEESNVPVSGGAGARQQNITGDGQFDNLDEASA
ncbi:Hypothetical predicted protein [Lecanosticta acicola]|uniref:Uncharacterized protein n=1 Tax=Lecanosticta acicola TaxID=111012 RepID=A0AAI8Z159_9PEZI|nr:Hypothetical predicted protein [Lecanosticta acicola]